MTLKAVPGGPSPEKPLWERDIIPVQRAKEKRDSGIGTKITQSQLRFIEVLCAQKGRPEIQTKSDFLYVGVLLALEYCRRATTLSPDLKKMAEVLQAENEMAARQEWLARSERLIDSLGWEIKSCCDTFGVVTKPAQFVAAMKNLERVKSNLPEDLRSKSDALWALYEAEYRKLKKP